MCYGGIVTTGPYTYSTPSTGGTVAMTTPQVTPWQFAIINPAGTLANLAVTLPACNAAADAYVAVFGSDQIITALTVSAASGSVVGQGSSLAVGGGETFICRGSATTWYRIS